jgi:predicted ATPase
MITGLKLMNLKCYKALSLPITSLTLLTGFNAGGKSTALQGALLISQALRENPRTRWLALNGPLVQLGTPGEVINKSTSERLVSIGVESNGSAILWRLDSEERGETDALPICKIEISDTVNLASYSPSEEEELSDLLPFHLERPPEVNDLIEALRSLIFLSATRGGAQEIFAAPQSSRPIHADIGTKGEFAAWWLERFSDEDVDPARRLASEPGTTLRRQVGAWGSELFPGFEASAQSLQKTGLIQLQLRTQITDEWRRPSNVGYGLSYAFPILVAGLLARPGQTLLIDSPEAHLHPKAQSRIGKFIAAMANSGVRVVVETHSDHVLNGVRLAVRDNLVKAEEVSVHFFSGVTDSDLGIASVHLDKDGAIDAWPTGFFDQSERDLAQLAGWE